MVSALIRTELASAGDSSQVTQASSDRDTLSY